VSLAFFFVVVKMQSFAKKSIEKYDFNQLKDSHGKNAPN
jgi:hypothetical protein